MKKISKFSSKHISNYTICKIRSREFDEEYSSWIMDSAIYIYFGYTKQAWGYRWAQHTIDFQKRKWWCEIFETHYVEDQIHTTFAGICKRTSKIILEHGGCERLKNKHLLTN